MTGFEHTGLCPCRYVVPVCGVGMISSIVRPQSSLMISEFSRCHFLALYAEDVLSNKLVPSYCATWPCSVLFCCLPAGITLSKIVVAYASVQSCTDLSTLR